jgi:hypothetical protein
LLQIYPTSQTHSFPFQKEFYEQVIGVGSDTTATIGTEGTTTGIVGVTTVVVGTRVGTTTGVVGVTTVVVGTLV